MFVCFFFVRIDGRELQSAGGEEKIYFFFFGVV